MIVRTVFIFFFSTRRPTHELVVGGGGGTFYVHVHVHVHVAGVAGTGEGMREDRSLKVERRSNERHGRIPRVSRSSLFSIKSCFPLCFSTTTLKKKNSSRDEGAADVEEGDSHDTSARAVCAIFFKSRLTDGKTCVVCARGRREMTPERVAEGGTCSLLAFETASCHSSLE